MIFDSCETHPLRLEWSSLQLCVGNTTYAGVSDIRLVRRQCEGTSKKSRPRKQASKKNPYQRAKTMKRRNRARELQLYRSLVNS